ncbi:PGPGW domain-containing protein [Nocardioides dilutus]
MRSAAKRVVLEVVGWVLVLAGIAALVLPGPGLLLLAAGLFVLSQQYEWAERRVDPILDRAMIGAAIGVEALWKVALSVLFALGLAACGVLWIKSPPVPDWWPFAESWWLPGGAATGITQVASAIIALGLIVWSYRRFHGRPDRVQELKERAAARAG